MCLLSLREITHTKLPFWESDSPKCISLLFGQLTARA